MTREDLYKELLYNAGTGIFTWLKPAQKRVVGNVAGCITPSGYVVICVNRKLYRAHHLAWLYVHGELPLLIDHINGNRSDNRISNLRPATHSQNSKNRKVSKKSKSGLKGVYLEKRTGRWEAQICTNGKNIYLGTFKSPHEAHEAYCIKAMELHGEFCRFN